MIHHATRNETIFLFPECKLKAGNTVPSTERENRCLTAAHLEAQGWQPISHPFRRFGDPLVRFVEVDALTEPPAGRIASLVNCRALDLG